MRPADRPLTSCLRVIAHGRKCSRNDPTQGFSSGAQLLRRSGNTGKPNSAVKTLNLRWRTPNTLLAKVESFIPWLILRLQDHEKNTSDPGFATFARNLVAILPKKSIGTAFETPGTPDEFQQSLWQPSEQSKPLSLVRSLRSAFVSNGQPGVDAQLKYAYQGLLAGRKFSPTDLADQEKIADLRYPVEWYPATRAVQRKVVLHVGPTNSGKTYHALKRLEAAESGIYAGPLRLLAHEVYSRLNAKGKSCDLVTGDERLFQEQSAMKSCTVEMVPLNDDVDVAVIDEIQMIGHRERGWAWTQALLGLKAKELHLCGEARSVPLIRELVASMGDELEIHNYERLSPLKMMSASLDGDLRSLKKGDCVVVFSRFGIHAMKRGIEKATQKRVAVVYGSLPPEVRAQQARLFNDPANDYDILVASDAIGMGLNLAIKRIIFESVSKFNGSKYEIIEASHIKQIAGRAGRYRTAAQAEGLKGNLDDVGVDENAPAAQKPSTSVGLVTTFNSADLPVLRKAMDCEMSPIMSAGLLPPTHILTKFATYFPHTTSFSYILLRLHELSRRHPRYHLCVLKDQVVIADVIQPVSGLTTHDRIIFCAAPASITRSDHRMTHILTAFARCVGEHSSGALLDICELPLEILDAPETADRAYLESLEILHKGLILYLWLSYRFAGVFVDQAMAFYVKRLTEEKIEKRLSEYSASPAIQAKIRKMRDQALLQIQELDKPTPRQDNPQARMEVSAAPLSSENISTFEEDSEDRKLSLLWGIEESTTNDKAASSANQA